MSKKRRRRNTHANMYVVRVCIRTKERIRIQGKMILLLDVATALSNPAARKHKENIFYKFSTSLIEVLGSFFSKA